ncbi:MAG: protein kinase [Lentisphaeria bacterium]|nr:protein kinase [Lentisphaeria bacterium]
MDFRFVCPSCGTRLEGDASLTGAEISCPNCQESVLVPKPELGEGVTIGGFRIERLLGQGGMGQVFLARQLSMDRPIALKVLSPAHTSDPEFLERFLHEVRLTAKLEHPNIVTAHEAGADGGIHYLAMTFVDGEDLEESLKREGHPMPERDALGVALACARGLRYAWEEFQLLHRDIKPANIMLDRRGEVHLMDLGLAKSMSEETNLTVTGRVMGTPAYMSPEQASGESLDVRADIYSLGATVYRLVTGVRPFEAPSVGKLIAMIIRDPLRSPREHNPNLSDDCVRLVEWMMAKAPDHRPESWAVVKKAIETVLAGDALGTAVAASAPSPGLRLKRKEETTIAQTVQYSAPSEGGDSDKEGRKSKKRIVLVVLAVLCALVVLRGIAKVRSARDGEDRHGEPSEMVETGADVMDQASPPVGSGSQPAIGVRPRYNRALEKVLVDLLKLQAAPASKLLGRLAAAEEYAAYSPETNAFQAVADAVDELPGRIMKSLRRDRGRTVILRMADRETVEGRILAVAPDHVTVSVTEEGVAKERSIPIRELAMVELYRRFGDATSPETEFVRGVLAYLSGSRQLSRKHFINCSSPVQAALGRHKMSMKSVIRKRPFGSKGTDGKERATNPKDRSRTFPRRGKGGIRR